VIVVFAFLAVLMVAAIAVVAITQVGTATTAQSASTDVRLVRLDMDRLRQDARDKDRRLADLASQAQIDAARVAEELRELGEADARIREDIARVSEQQKQQAELNRVAQQELSDRLTQVTKRVEALTTEVVPRETGTLQGQITDSKGRIDRTERDVAALRQALRETDVPGLRAKVQEVDREVARIGTDLEALAKASEAFRVQMTEASEAFRAQVTEFFQTILYNDPWGRNTPETPAPPSP